MEHLNRTLKDCIKGLGPNQTENGIGRIGKAMGVLGPFLAEFDNDNGIAASGGRHNKKESQKERALMVNELTKTAIYKHIANRKHDKFPHPRNILHGKSQEKLSEWMEQKLKKNFKEATSTT